MYPPALVSLRRASPELEAGIRDKEWSAGPKPFIWADTADEILGAVLAYCRRINDLGH